jgi:type VI secretion system secreted protein VgrG
VIAYLDGDPDEPMVVGSVNNAVAPAAEPIPQSQTQSWWRSKSTPDGDGFNAVLMEDLKGGELLALRAERDFRSHTGRRSQTIVGENSLLEVTGSHSTRVGGGQSTNVGGDLHVAVGGAYYLQNAGMVVSSSQAIDMSAEGNFSIESTSGERVDKAAIKHHIESPAIFLHGHAGVQVLTAKFHVCAGDEIVLQAGTSSITMVNGKITLSAALIELNP